MPSVRPVPLAWKNLTHDRVRFSLFAAGIGFAVVLMGVQLGIMNAMLDGNTLLVAKLNADLVMINPNRPALLFQEGFSRRRLEQTEGVRGVESVHAIYIDYQFGQLRDTAADPHDRSQTRPLRVVGVDPASRAIDLPNLDADSWSRLNLPGTALFDRRSRPRQDGRTPGETVFGKFEQGTRTELAGREITFVGGFDLGFDFSTDGTIVLSDRTFARYLRDPYYPASPMSQVDLGVIRVRPGESVEQVQKQIEEAVCQEGDVVVLTKEEMISRERQFWWTSTPIGFAFGAGVVLGFVVGVVICYQILSSDVADHVAEYATLKAIGYSNAYLSRIVIEEALILAISGFIPGLVVTYGVYLFLTDLSALPLKLTFGRAAFVLALTVVMCIASGLFAIGKVKKVDPADVF